MTVDKVSTATNAQTLSRGIDILEAIACVESGLTVAEVADRIAVHRTVANRLVRTLERHRLLRPLADGRFTLGLGLASLGARVGRDIHMLAMPHLARLAEETRATSLLNVTVDTEWLTTLVQVSPPTVGPYITYTEGVRRPLGVGAPGVALLAAEMPREGERHVVKRARALGFAYTEDELQPNTVGVAVPLVVSGEDAIYSVSVAMFKPVFDIDAIVKLVKTCSLGIAHEMGGVVGPAST